MKNKKLFGPTILLISQYTSKIVGPLVSLLLIRYLSVEDYGYYATAIAVTTLLGVFSNFGLQQSIVSIEAQKKYSLQSILKKAIKIGLIYSTLSYIIVLLWVFIIDYDVKVRIIGLITGLSFIRILLVSILSAGLQVVSKFQRIGIWTFIVNTSQWVGTLLAIWTKQSLYNLVLIPIITTTIIIAIMFIIEGRNLSLFKGEKNSISNRKIINESWLFGLNGSLYQFYHRSDIVILSIFRSPMEVGLYSVAFKLLELIYFLPGVIFNQVLYPKYFFWSKNDLKKYRTYYYIMNKLMFLLGVIILSVIFLYSKELIHIIFGNENLKSYSYLLIMSFAIPFRFLIGSVSSILVTNGYLNEKLKIESFIAFFNISLNIIFIPFYGATGASILMVITDILLFIFYSFVVGKHEFGIGEVSKKNVLLVTISVLCVFISILLKDKNLILKEVSTILIFITISIVFYVWQEKREKILLKSLLT